MKALKKKDLEIQKLRDLCSELRQKIIQSEVENTKLKKELKK